MSLLYGGQDGEHIKGEERLNYVEMLSASACGGVRTLDTCQNSKKEKMAWGDSESVGGGFGSR